jgi:putative membrane protein insertion efficiency factor
MRDRSGWIVFSPLGIFGGRRPRASDDQGYDPRYGRGNGRRGGGGGGCLRDAMLLEGGCCLAEALGGNCLLWSAWLMPALLHALSRPGSAYVPGPTASSRPQRSLLALIGAYQRNVSARRSKSVCRFTPSCSTYASEAITRYGALSGSRRAAGRLLRCRPGTAGGADPVDLPPAGRTAA